MVQMGSFYPGIVFFRIPPSLLQGELHFLPKPLFLRKRGCNRPPVLGTATLYGWRGIKALRQIVRDGTAWGGMGTAWGQHPHQRFLRLTRISRISRILFRCKQRFSLSLTGKTPQGVKNS